MFFILMRNTSGTCPGLDDGDDMMISNQTKSLHIEVKILVCARRSYPYFGAVVGFVWSYDAESYAGGSLCYWWSLLCQTGQG
jgi:hypothetical protein